MPLLVRSTHLLVSFVRILAGIGILLVGLFSFMSAILPDETFPWLIRLVLLSPAVLIGIYLVCFLRRTQKPINPESVRESTALLAFIAFMVITSAWKKYLIVDIHPDNIEWAALILAIVLFSLHRTVSYWMIQFVFTEERQSSKDQNNQAVTDRPATFSPPNTSRTMM